MAWHLKGQIAKCDNREYGHAKVQVTRFGSSADELFEGLGDELEVRTATVIRLCVRF